MRSPSSNAAAAVIANETRWTRGASLVLIAALLFIALNAAQVVYRLTIPSLGWVGTDPDTDVVARGFYLERNAVGAESPLLPGDIVTAVSGLEIVEILAAEDLNFTSPPGWEIGRQISLTVLRDGRELVFDAPVVRWTPAAWWRVNFGRFSEIWQWLATLIWFGVVTFTLLKRPDNLAGRFLFAFGLANFSIVFSESLPDHLAYYLNAPAAIGKVFFSNIIFAYLLGPSFLGFALTFPRPKKFIQQHSLWLLVPYLVGSTTIVLFLTVPKLAVAGFLFTFVMLLLGVAALIHTALTMRDAISRAQLRWAVGGVTLGAGLFLLNFASFQPAYRDAILALANLGFPIIMLSLSVAILRYRLFDIDVIIRRTLQYTILTGLLALAYFGNVVVLQTVIENLTGEQSPVVIVVSTLAIAALFNPLRLRIQDFIDRRFFRQKYDAEQMLANFAAVARDEVDMDKLTDSLLAVVGETIQPEKASLWLKTSKKKGSYE